MRIWANKKKRKIFIVVTAMVLVLASIIMIFGIYVNDYYHADMDAIQAFLPQEAQWQQDANGTIVFEPKDAQTGFIFYPGGKVAHTAYIPLMQALSAQGVLCILIEMPFNLAVLDMNAADGIQEKYPQIERWYIGGHSLGGSMAASYLEKNADAYEGLVLLGAYSTVDLSGTDLDVLSIYGSEDKVMNREKYDSNKSHLPKDLTEIVIEGGCHAHFGMYGAQDGDGVPVISAAEQITITADKIIEMMQAFERR